MTFVTKISWSEIRWTIAKNHKKKMEKKEKKVYVKLKHKDYKLYLHKSSTIFFCFNIALVWIIWLWLLHCIDDDDGFLEKRRAKEKFHLFCFILVKKDFVIRKKRKEKTTNEMRINLYNVKRLKTYERKNILHIRGIDRWTDRQATDLFLGLMMADGIRNR